LEPIASFRYGTAKLDVPSARLKRRGTIGQRSFGGGFLVESVAWASEMLTPAGAINGRAHLWPPF
jgi:hypothetical protein